MNADMMAGHLRSSASIGGYQTLPVFLLLAATLALSSLARAAESDALVTQWLAAQTNVQTWSANLVQTRSLQTMSLPLISTGSVWFAAPDRFRWEIGSPAATIAVRQPDLMLVIYPKLRRVERYPLRGPELAAWKNTLALLEAGFPRSRGELDARFKLLGQQVTNGNCELALEPKAPSARRMLPRLEVAFSTNDFDLRATTLHFADGSILKNEFIHTQRNQPAAETLFSPVLDPAYEVVEPLGKSKP